MTNQDRTRINMYLQEGRRGAHVTAEGERSTHTVFDPRVGVVPLTWDSHRDRCATLGIPYGSDGPYLSEPGE